MHTVQKSTIEIVKIGKTTRFTNLNNKYKYGTYHVQLLPSTKNFPQMLGLKSANSKRVIARIAIISRYTCPKPAVHFTGSFFFADLRRNKGF